MSPESPQRASASGLQAPGVSPSDWSSPGSAAASPSAPSGPPPATASSRGSALPPPPPVGWRCFPALVPGFLLSNVESALASVALPFLQVGLEANLSQVSLVPLLSLLPTATLSPLAGLLADRLGRRPVYLAGLSIFGLGSLLCLLAPGFGPLLVGRVLQGLGMAAIVANGLAIMADHFEETARGPAVGRMTALVAVTAILAPPLSAGLCTYVSWRGIFGLEAILALLGVGLVRARLPIQAFPSGPRLEGLPWHTAAALSLAGVTSMGGVWWLGRTGGLSGLTGLLMGLGGLGLALAWLWNAGPTPLLRLGSLPRGVSRAFLTLFLASAALSVPGVILPLYLHAVKGVEGLALGLRVLPLPLGLVLGALVGARLLRGPWEVWVERGGLILGGVGLALCARWLEPSLLLVGAGLGAFSVGNNVTLVHDAGAEAGARTGLAGLLRLGGGLLGVSVAGALLQARGPGVGLGWAAVFPLLGVVAAVWGRRDR